MSNVGSMKTFTAAGGSSAASGGGSGIGNATGNGASSGSGLMGLGGLAGRTGGDAGHPETCTDAGCTCINIASIGHEGVWGPCSSDSTTALQNWLNTQSTAKVDNFDTAKPTLTADFLAKYNVVLLQWMVENGEQNNNGAAWVFTANEVSALETWVKASGGLIVLSGYERDGMGYTIYDTTAPNQLLRGRTSSTTPTTCTTGPARIVIWGGSLPVGGLLQTPASGDAGPVLTADAPALGTWNTSSPIASHVGDIARTSVAR